MNKPDKKSLFFHQLIPSMKKFSILLLTMSLLVITAGAQRYDEIKTRLTLRQYKDAKQLVDKGMANAKFTSKPEAYMLKATVYSSLAIDTTLQAAEATQLREEAYSAFTKYREMEPEMKLISDMEYGNTPGNIYAAYFNAGFKDYLAKNWEAGLPKLEKAVAMGDLLTEKKLWTVTADTNALILAAVVADNAKQEEAAVKYYSRLAELKLNTPDYEEVYRYLVRYYAAKKDDANFEKYRALGKELYPKSEYFTYDKVDFAIGTVEGFDEQVKALQEVLSKDPGNYKANMGLGELLYDTLNSRREGAVQPGNAPELEVKMIEVLTKAAEINPAKAAQAYIYIGDHYMNKADRKQNELTELETEIRKRPGAKATAADNTKKADLKKQYDAVYDQGREYFEKAAELFAKKSELDKVEKRQYKLIVGSLAQYYSYKREGAKGADLNKYIAAEKKWNDLDETLR